MLLTIKRERLDEAVDPSSDWKIVFLHTPKTSGMSFLEMFRAVYGSNRVAWAGVIAPAQQLVPFAWDSHKVIGGHVTFRTFSDLDLSKVLFVSVVRDPVERTLSHFRHIMKWPQQFSHLPMLKPGAIARHLDNPALRREIANLQCYFVSGAPNYRAAHDVLSRSHFVLCTLPEVNELATTFSATLPTVNQGDAAPGLTNEKWLLEIASSINHEDAILYDSVVRGSLRAVPADSTHPDPPIEMSWIKDYRRELFEM